MLEIRMDFREVKWTEMDKKSEMWFWSSLCFCPQSPEVLHNFVTGAAVTAPSTAAPVASDSQFLLDPEIATASKSLDNP